MTQISVQVSAQAPADELDHASLLQVLARAAAPLERIGGGWVRPSGDSAVGLERFRRWADRIADGHPPRVAEILAEHGVTRREWCAGLGGVSVVPGEQPPRWAQDAITLLELVGSEQEPPPAPRLGEVAGDELPTWVDPDQPWRFHPGFQDWLAVAGRDVDRWAEGAPVSARVRRDLVLQLARRMLFACGALLMQAAAERPLGRPLFVPDARADWQQLWSSHPVVARLLAVVWRQWRETTGELCGRIADDLPEVCPGVEVTAIELSAGDLHCGGRGVARLGLSDGTSVFLKPRSDGLRDLLAGVLARVEEVAEPLGLRLPTVVERNGYVWVREVVPADCADEVGVDAYFRRAGALLRIFQALGSTDLHHENFVPAGDLPVLVDLETVVAAGPLRTAAPDDAVAQRLADTPGPTSMVTSIVTGPPGRGVVDLGALAGPSRATTPYTVPTLALGSNGPELIGARVPMDNGAALPTRQGRRVPLRGHEAALIAGYTDAQRRLESLVEDEIISVPDREPELRFVARPTRTYVRLLGESTAPSALVDGVERELVLERLYRATGTGPPGLIGCEVDAMRELDVPLFTVAFHGTDLVSDRGTVLPDVFRLSPATRTTDRLRRVAERRDHLDDLRATLFAMAPRDLPAPTDAADGPDPAVDRAEPIRMLLDRAIVSRTEGADSVSWIGLEHDPNRNSWSFGRMGAGLAGQAGIGLTLATIAARCADPPAGTGSLAGAALLTCVDRIGSGADGPADAFGGPAGVLYATASAARLLADPVLLDAARSLLRPALRAARRGVPSVVMDGTAGAILALLQLPRDETVDDALAELAALLEATDLPSDPAAVDRPDVWSASLPTRAFGRAFARHRLGLAHPELSAGSVLPPATGAGDAIGSVIVGSAERPRLALSEDTGLRRLLDDAALGAAALRSGVDAGSVARRRRSAQILASRRARTGQWCAGLPVADATLLSPVHGIPAVALLCSRTGPDVPIARALT